MPDIQLWPDWKIVREIGRGSFGEVYEIHRQNGNFLERAALKVIRIPQNPAELEQLYMDGIGEDETEAYLERYVEEIRNEIGLMQRLVGYSNIVSYEDYLIRKHTDSAGWDILIRMELLTALPAYMTSHEMSEQDVIRLGLDISRALIICHEAGIIHRDIKPQNIFLNRRKDFKLGDFGISRAMPGSGSVLSFKGTISYMAPETFAMRFTDARSDIYSLALVLYRILNGGREPFLDNTGFTPAQREAAQMRRMRGETLPDPERGSPVLCRILSIALAADPAVRYQTARQFHQALEGAVAEKRAVTFNTGYYGAYGGPEASNTKNISAPYVTRTVPVFMDGIHDPLRRSSNESRGAAAYRDPNTGGRSQAGQNAGKTNPAGSYVPHQKQRSLDPVRPEQSAPRNRQTELLQKPIYTDLNGNIKSIGGGGDGRSSDVRLKASIIMLSIAAVLLLVFAGWSLFNGIQSGQEHAGDENVAVSEEREQEQTADDGNDVQEVPAESVTEDTNPQAGGDSGGTAAVSGGGYGKTLTLEEAVEESDYIVRFEDGALENAVRTYLHIYDRPITKEEALEQRVLNLSGKNLSNADKITDLTGLSAFANLEELNVQENLITDLSELSTMYELETLHLEGNAVMDLDPVSDLSDLKTLDLDRNTVSDVSALSGLTGLTMLDLRNNRVDDISALSALTSMKELYLSDNEIEEISAVRSMPDLWYLSMNNNPVTDLSPVNGRDKLTTLCLSGTQVEDIDVVTRLPALSYLDVRDCTSIRSRAPLSKLRKRGGVTIKE